MAALYESTESDIQTKAKRLRTNDSDTKIKVSKQLENLDGFKIVKVLNENNLSKIVFVHGTICDDGNLTNAIAILEKTGFPKDSLHSLLSKDLTLEKTLVNDIYGSYLGMIKPELNKIQVTLIHPATQKHIDKYTEHEAHLLKETADDYNSITLPHIESQGFAIQWVYNILEKKKESEHIVFEDPDSEIGFILLPDMKWDKSQLESLYLVAIAHKHGIKSLRDLREDSLPLLKNIRNKTLSAVKETYGVLPSKLRLYVHYRPSYYHFHVHVTHLKFDAPGSGVTRAHLLDDVIRNIELAFDFYETQPLMFVVKENDELFQKYKSAGKIAENPC